MVVGERKLKLSQAITIGSQYTVSKTDKLKRLLAG